MPLMQCSIFQGKKSRHLSIISMGRWDFQGQMCHKKHILEKKQITTNYTAEKDL